MTFVNVIPAMVHQNLDLNWSSYGGIWGAQFSKYLHYARGMVLHDLPGGQYVTVPHWFKAIYGYPILILIVFIIIKNSGHNLRYS